ncbi:SGNH/GDSL hydrolase family protein [Streptomyces naganishii]|uniref:SGNH hydrolase n=1 Tax=Streptomyces naganishii JCM 4654 TaxID=1306179 RepID=A0A918Y6A4_9ACTN|nr:SGNH/GDSL hydrolase family protein [Streptomyces naganishii]GHD90690.1 SGNH hydrolase [Streptomyces naganishii JCM 4654]
MEHGRRAAVRAAARVLAALLLLPGTTAATATTATAIPATAATARAAPAPIAPLRPDPARPPVWTGTWESAPSGTAPALPGASIRNVIRTSVGGAALRVRLSNRLGRAPLRLGAVTVALRRAGGPGAVPGSLRAAVFRGARTVTVPPGRDVVSDPVRLAVPAAADLLVTVYTPGDSGPATYHRTALRTGYVAPGGDRAADADGSAYTVTTTHWYYVTGVDVLGARAAGSVVAFGDSLTDGTGSTFDTGRRWPDRLAERLRALPPARRLAVLNAGVSGNRLLRDGEGPAALTRLDADALSRAGVRALVVWEGINDVKGTPEAGDPAAFATAYRAIVARAHARGIRVVGATLTPYGGHGAYTAAREAVRREVNDLIRHGGLFDAVADFDAVVRDPARPWRIRPAYDSGDHLHLDDAGLRAVADSVVLGTLLGCGQGGQGGRGGQQPCRSRETQPRS